jgi:hypothetical protein
MRKVMGVRKFRETFPTLTEPTEVIRATRGMEILGVWIPNESRTSPYAQAFTSSTTTHGAGLHNLTVLTTPQGGDALVSTETEGTD